MPSLSVRSNICRTVAHQAPLVYGVFQARIVESGEHILLQAIFPTQGSNLPQLLLLHWQEYSLPLSDLGKSPL